jgi:hypothetical protein
MLHISGLCGEDFFICKLIRNSFVPCPPYWNDWLIYCCLLSTQQFFSYIMARTSSFSMRWWWWSSLCTRPTRLVGFL